jgi:2,4-dienoyl-CoA reductase-like NADH-dependent reductase (Old Yellow Enzyme family)/thioredoxin reductase
MSMKNYPHVFDPIKIGTMVLKNRLQFLPIVCCMTSSEGEVIAEMVEFVGAQARTGVGLITIGDTQINHERCDCFYGEMNVTHNKFVPGMQLVTEEAHRYGAKISIELSHSGRGAQASMITKPSYAVSNIPLDKEGCPSDLIVMTQKEIDEVIGEFVACARRCKQAGFDMIMVHSAHNNLLGQFLSPASNIRTDEYGGSFENRMRFPKMVLEAVRDTVGPNYPLEMRVSCDEMIENGLRLDDTIAYLKEVQHYVNMIQVSRGTIFEQKYQKYLMPTYYQPRCINVGEAAKIRAAIDIPISVAGYISSIEEAEEIISSGKSDIVGMARSYIADPDIIKKAVSGESGRTRPCLRCFEGCGVVFFGYPLRCTVNPVFGREFRYKEIHKAPIKKKVMIIGGGPAGMTAAQTAIKRGHDVVLYEKKNRLGGLLEDAGTASFKSNMRKYLEWHVSETMSCGARIELGKEAGADHVRYEAPDALIIATGSDYAKPPIRGIDNGNVIMVRDVEKNQARVGQKVVVCGGGLTGCECALSLAMDGKNVTIMDMINVDQFAGEMFFLTRNALMDELDAYKVKKAGNLTIDEFSEKGVKAKDTAGKIVEFEADTIVLALGMKSENKLNHFVYEDLAKEVFVVGDCDKVSNIRFANFNAFNVAVEL